MTPARAVLAGAGAVAIVAPIVALTGHRPAPRPAPAVAVGPIVPSAAASLDAALARPLFDASATPAPPDASQGSGSEDAPQVVGIVGRLPDQAVVLVRRASGRTRTIGIGDTVDGWRLVSIAADAVLFEQGDRRARIDVAAGEPADQ